MVDGETTAVIPDENSGQTPNTTNDLYSQLLDKVYVKYKISYTNKG